MPGATAKHAIQFTPADFKWVDAPRSMPAGTKIQVLEGNPTRSGLFTMRVKLPAQTTQPDNRRRKPGRPWISRKCSITSCLS